MEALCHPLAERQRLPKDFGRMLTGGLASQHFAQSAFLVLSPVRNDGTVIGLSRACHATYVSMIAAEDSIERHQASFAFNP
jgi:hypothetical protein